MLHSTEIAPEVLSDVIFGGLQIYVLRARLHQALVSTQSQCYDHTCDMALIDHNRQQQQQQEVAPGTSDLSLIRGFRFQHKAGISVQN